ncbi:MAG: tetratricopeptide repeat protein, partial [Pseudomonadota bacterium]
IELRATMRDRMRASPVMDGPGFAKGVEDAFRKMYATWTAQLNQIDEVVAPGVASPAFHADAERVIAQALQKALACQDMGEFATAEALYRSILDVAPQHPVANHNLGILAVQLGDAVAALPLLQAALEADPQRGQYWLSYIDASIKAGRRDAAQDAIALSRESGLEGEVLDALERSLAAVAIDIKDADTALVKQKPSKRMTPHQIIESSIVLFQQGRFAEAEAQARTLVASHPKNGNGWKILGAILQKQNRPVEALTCSQKAVQLLPNDFEALSNLGAAFNTSNNCMQAEAMLRRALRLKPTHPESLNNLGNALKGQQRYAEAEQCYRRALKARPEWPEVYGNLGFTLNKLNRLDEAESFQRQALVMQPHNALLNNQLGITLRHMGQIDEAEHCYRQAIACDAVLADAHNNLGLLLQMRLKLVEARQCFVRAIEADPAFGEASSNLGTAHAYLSDFSEVVACSDRALATGRDLPVMWEQRLYAFSYHADLSAAQIYREFERWGERFPMPVTDFSRHDRTPGRRLRIGYVSPDFRRHTSRFYFLPLFANHDPATVELFAYSNVFTEDSFTEQFKAVFDHWRPIRHLDDTTAAQLIRDDNIDILVDCCNHMQGDRLGVFTLKPAPIQATWLGAAWTTGLKMIDYVLSDPYMAPEGTLTSETIVRLPHFFVAYQPPETTAEVVVPPHIKNGYLTFGYSGRTERLNHHTFRVWGKILEELPTARLILDFSTFENPDTQAYYIDFMTRQDVDTSRVIMRRSPNIFEGLGDIDILLDCFPHSGGTMLFDALWMGVPALTLAGRPPVGLIGTSLMINLGLPEWVARSEQEYIEKACAFAKQPEGLVELRATMRERMRASPVMDGPGFAKGVEAAFQEMYTTWCDTTGKEQS